MWAFLALNTAGLMSKRVFNCALATGFFVLTFCDVVMAHWAHVGIDGSITLMSLYFWFKHKDDDRPPRNSKKLKNALKKFAVSIVRPVDRILAGAKA